MTKNSNNLYYLITGIITMVASIPDELLPIIPSKYKPYVIGAGVIAMWVKGHINLFTPPPQEQPK